MPDVQHGPPLEISRSNEYEQYLDVVRNNTSPAVPVMQSPVQ